MLLHPALFQLRVAAGVWFHGARNTAQIVECADA
jgi:hypothetical protein